MLPVKNTMTLEKSEFKYFYDIILYYPFQNHEEGVKRGLSCIQRK